MPAHASSRLVARIAAGVAGIAFTVFAAGVGAQALPDAESAPPVPVETKPATGDAKPGSTATTPAAPTAPPVDFALVLPLDTPAYARAADAVRAGFRGAAEAAGALARTKVYAHGDDGVITAFESARTAGARVIVGPLLRDDLRVVATIMLELPPTIALNQLDDGTDPPANLYTFALSIDSDARQIARRMRADVVAAVPATATAPAAAGAPNVVVIGADTPLFKRFGTAFTTEWIDAGGSAPGALRFEPTAEAMSAMRRDFGRKAPDAALLAIDGAGAALAKPYLGSIPTYASGLVFERVTPAVIRDLDGLVVTEIPWIIDPGAPQFAALPKREQASAALTRLYALGLDAFRVAQAFRDGAPERFKLDGATGQITFDGRQFLRESRFAVFRTGQLAPLNAAR
jgi:outer membrane PBP1 activator LpoA protein